MHRIVVQTIVIDTPSGSYKETRDFWSEALNATSRREDNRPEYDDLDGCASPCRVVVQDVGTTAARIHFDIETDDLLGEVDRLKHAGAEEVGRRDHWVVMSDPSGHVFCVVSRPPWPRNGSANLPDVFEVRSSMVGEVAPVV